MVGDIIMKQISNFNDIAECKKILCVFIHLLLVACTDLQNYGRINCFDFIVEVCNVYISELKIGVSVFLLILSSSLFLKCKTNSGFNEKSLSREVNKVSLNKLF